jgi:uncharacterized integral membrane protein
MKLDKELEDSINGLRWKINTFFVIAIILALAALVIYILHLIFSTNINDFFSGEGTDIVNGFTVLLASISGVLFVYIAFLGQQWQLIYQQQEIRENRKEMKESIIQSSIQAKALTEQISKMERDFVHQNFFRILDQHFKTRDSVKFSYRMESLDLESASKKIKETTGGGENGFDAYFKKLVLWVDDKSGWEQKIDEFEEHIFFTENGYRWIHKRNDIKELGDRENWKFKEVVFADDLTNEEIKFLIRVVMTESGFGPFLRSCYYLFGYMMNNKLHDYLDAVEAGMNRHERSFLFYQIATRFEVDGRIDLKRWLINKRFLANIEPKHLLLSEHINLLYPDGSDRESKNKFKNPHP